MNITVIDNIKKQYIEALSKDPKYNEVLKSILSRKENEPISHFSSLNPEELPDKDKEERELQELLLDLTALNSGIIEVAARVDNVFSSVDYSMNTLKASLGIEEEESEDLEETEEHREENIETMRISSEPALVRNQPHKVEKIIRKQSGGENVVAINQKQALQKSQITIVEPRLYSEAEEVEDYLLASQTIILNFRRMEKDQATKLLDFLMGITYSIKGDIQRLDEELFICTPKNVTLNGSDLSEYSDSLL